MTGRRFRRNPGDIVLVPLDDHRFSYARVLREPLMEFYDGVASSHDSADAQNLSAMKPLFRIWVMNSAITSGRWKAVGHRALSIEEQNRVDRFYKQDKLSKKLTIYWTDPVSQESHEVPALLADCLPLERAAVWSAEHVEDRLRDFHAGVKNKWVELSRPKSNG